MISKQRKYIVAMLALLICISLSACNARNNESAPPSSPLSQADNQTLSPDALPAQETEQNTTTAEYRKITPEKAKEMLDSGESIILLDVRSIEEYQEMHIDSAILIPDTEIIQKADAELPDKDAIILIYCRSGPRSALAAQALVELGYIGIYDFGGIQDLPYETVGGQ